MGLFLRPAPANTSAFRVQPDDYRKNLGEIKSLCDKAGIEVWFLTAPHALDISIPDYLYNSGEVEDPSELVEIHQGYNEILRSVATESKTRVVDLDYEINQLNKFKIFIEDHIHLSLAGRNLVADILVRNLAETGRDLSPAQAPGNETAQ